MEWTESLALRPVARNDDGTVTAAGRPRPELTHPTPPGLLESLVREGGRHSPLIGFALDGYPIYGPWGLTAQGELRRMRSSYRLRDIDRREVWNGIALTPAQYGPDVDTERLGAFAEDYEYAAGSGDLDEFNGCFTRTPEYPDGTYAYFLATDAAGRLAYPYLVGPRYYGEVASRARQRWLPLGERRLRLSIDQAPRVHEAVTFRIEARERMSGETVRHFETVHERPIHFIVASQDLTEFHHLHPELAADESYQLQHMFQQSGKYHVWLDYSLPGEPPNIDEFAFTVPGRAPVAKPLVTTSLKQTVGPVRIMLEPAKPLCAGDDIPLSLQLTGDLKDVEPYLGAWAHVMLVRSDGSGFTHLHPLGDAPASAHDHSPVGPAPSGLAFMANFPVPGRYKLWAQIQVRGEVLTAPFVIVVQPEAAARKLPAPRSTVPADAISRSRDAAWL